MTSHEPETTRPGAPVEELLEAECWELLRTATVGRIATAAPGEAPVVIPVNHVVRDGSIFIRLGVGTTLRGIRQGRASYEVDVVDDVHRRAWSVLVRGLAYECTSTEVGALAVEPWARTRHARWVRLLPEEITGRRLADDGAHQDDRGYL